MSYRGGGETCRNNHISSQVRGELLESRGMIDGRADHGEVEPALCADIAVGDFAQVQRDSEADLRNARRPAFQVACGDRRDRCVRGSQGGCAMFRRIAAFGDLENR